MTTYFPPGTTGTATVRGNKGARVMRVQMGTETYWTTPYGDDVEDYFVTDFVPDAERDDLVAENQRLRDTITRGQERAREYKEIATDPALDRHYRAAMRLVAADLDRALGVSGE